MSMVRPTTASWLRDRSGLFFAKQRCQAIIHSRHQVDGDDHHDDNRDELGLQGGRHRLQGCNQLCTKRLDKCNRSCDHSGYCKDSPLSAVDWDRGACCFVRAFAALAGSLAL